MIFTVEILFITVSVVVILGGVVYLLHRPSKGDRREGNKSQESGDPHI